MRRAPFLIALGFLALSASAWADAPVATPDDVGSTTARDPQVERLRGAQRSRAWTYTPAGSRVRYGHAEALMDASAATMTRLATDFDHYKDLHKKFASARVVGRNVDGTDVFMRYPIWIGPLHVDFRQTLRFGPVRTENNVQILEARSVNGGDMREGHARVKIRPVGPNQSLVEVDILLVPKMPAPQSLIDSELRDGAFDFVNGLGARAAAEAQRVTAAR